MPGFNFAPYPRQTLGGGSGGSGVVYYSETFDFRDLRFLRYAMETYSSIPGLVAVPATMFLQCSNDVQGPWEELIPGGDGPLVGDLLMGDVLVTGRFLRVRVSISDGEVVTFGVQFTARTD